MELGFDAAPAVRIERREEPFVFDGGWKTTCRLLGGPVKDMNLMVDISRAHSTLRVLPLEAVTRLLVASQWALYYVLRGEATFSILGLEEVVAAGELLHIDDAEGFPIPAAASQPGTAIVEIGIRAARMPP
jgi:environmental stress-induced protein Ves